MELRQLEYFVAQRPPHELARQETVAVADLASLPAKVSRYGMTSRQLSSPASSR